MPVFLLLDFLWLGVVSTRFYTSQLEPWLRKAPDGSLAPYWAPAVLLYVLIVVGLAAFVVPRVEAAGGSLPAAAAWGALFGLVVYSAWDLTNYSVLNNWPLVVTTVDMGWGAVVCAVTTMAMVAATRSRG